MVVVVRDLNAPDKLAITELGVSRITEAAGFVLGAGQVMTADQNAAYEPHLFLSNSPKAPQLAAVTDGYFSVLGLSIIGRSFSQTDKTTGGPIPIVISDDLWRAEWGGSTEVIGTVVSATPRPVVVVGIAPSQFHGARLGEHFDAWVPVWAVPELIATRLDATQSSSLPLIMFARVGLGSTASTAETALRGRAAYRRFHVVPLRTVFGTASVSTIAFRSDEALLAVSATAILVLISGCITLCALVLVHYERRRQEAVVRLALGATVGALLRQWAGELTLLALAGALGAIAVAWLGLRLLPRVVMANGVDLGRVEFRLAPEALLVAILATSTTMVLTAVVSLRRAARPRLNDALTDSGSTAPKSSIRLRQWLLAGHVAISTSILILAGLFVRSVRIAVHESTNDAKASAVFVDMDAWFESQQTPDAFARSAAQARVAAEEVVRQIRGLPGVDTVAFGGPPIGPARMRELQDPRELRIGDVPLSVRYGWLSVRGPYFAALGRPVNGRSSSEDISGSEAIISRSLADLADRGRGVLGERISVGQQIFTIVGVVDVPFGSFRFPDPCAIFTGDLALFKYTAALPLVIQARRPEQIVPAVRAILTTEFPAAPRVNVFTGQELLRQDVGQESLASWFFSGFGIVEVILCLTSITGLVAYLVESRRRELLVRIALGATTRRLTVSAMSQVMAPVAHGIACGVIGGILTGRLLSSWLIGITATDPSTYVAITGVLLFVAGVASFVGSRGVSQIALVSTRQL